MSGNENRAAVIECDSFDDFIARVRTTKWVFPRIFRGQRDVTWGLSSIWERHLDSLRGAQPDRNVDELFSHEGRETRNRMRDSFRLGFSNQIVGLPGVRTTELTSERDVWAIGRHHGLVTPLLDWTRSPFVACFFACFDHLDHYNPGFREGARGFGAGVNVSPTHPVAVWELAHDDETQVSAEFEIFESRIDQAHRQRAQQGVFTMLTHHTALDLESYLVTRDLGLRLARYEIPGSEVGKALWNLRLMNITYGTLYPDLDGAAIEANTAQHIRPFSFHYRPDS